MSKSREENRKNFPWTAAKMDVDREIFGSGVSLRFASEDGKEIGKRDKRIYVIPIIHKPVEIKKGKR